jgi:tetratricopeptide (TPR) repeat protein
MKSLRNILIIALLLMMGTPTIYSQSRKLEKKGAELEENGLPEEAADYYYQALLDKSDNIDAFIGLKRTAPKLLDRKLQAMINAFNLQDFQTAFDKYNDAVNYQAKVLQVGVELEISKPFTDKFNESKEILADKYYVSGKSQYDYGNYDAAISDLEKCLSYKSPFKDAIDLLSAGKEAKNIADAELYYKSGFSKLNSEDYRSAYYDFEKCLAFKSPYKDAAILKAEALEKGKVRIGIFEFTNDTKVYGVHGTLYSYVVTNAVNYESPFIEVVERDNLQRLLDEQKLGMSGIVDESSAAQAGKILSLNYVVMGRLINVLKTGGDVTSQQVSAYELYSATTSDGITVQRGRPVTYTVHEGSSEVTFEASYQVISVETSQILTSDIVSASDSDHVKYATYGGDPKKLCTINPDQTFVMQLLASTSMVDQKQFSARQKMKTPDEMQTAILKELASKIAKGICGQFE